MWSAWSKPPILIKDGFEVFPDCTEDLSVAMRLVDAGCKVVMPWAAPIGSASGIINRYALKLLRDRLPDITLVAMPVSARRRMRQKRSNSATTRCCSTPRSPGPPTRSRWRARSASGVEAGRAAYEAGLMEARDFASPSTPVIGTPFWHAVS